MTGREIDYSKQEPFVHEDFRGMIEAETSRITTEVKKGGRPVKLYSKEARKQLRETIKFFHKLTFEVQDFYSDTYSYPNRLAKFEKVWAPMVNSSRIRLKLALKEDKDFRQIFFDYLSRSGDLILFGNAFAKAIDQRKFGAGLGEIPFTVYWYQVVLWEMYQYFSFVTVKPRDMGVSFAIYLGVAMQMCLRRPLEIFFASEKAAKVDIKNDTTQSSMGRTEALINNTGIWSTRYFHDRKIMHMYAQPDSGITGVAMTRTALNQLRGDSAFFDESGTVPFIDDVDREITQSVTRKAYVGTLLPGGGDRGFRKIISGTQNLPTRDAWDRFALNLSDGMNYRAAWAEVIRHYREQYTQGTVVALRLKYQDHPLKTGNCDYYDIACAELMGDEVAIAMQLDANENAGSPNRSFYKLTDENFIADKEFEEALDAYRGRLVLESGFDPGGHHHAAMIPMFCTPDGFFYIDLPYIFKNGIMDEFIQDFAEKYPRAFGTEITIRCDSAVVQYSDEGALWHSIMTNKSLYPDLSVKTVSNRSPHTKIQVCNWAFNQKKLNPRTGRIEPLIKFRDNNLPTGNRAWAMHATYGDKYSGSVEKALISHPFDAAMYLVSDKFLDNFERARYAAGRAASVAGIDVDRRNSGAYSAGS